MTRELAEPRDLRKSEAGARLRLVVLGSAASPHDVNRTAVFARMGHEVTMISVAAGEVPGVELVQVPGAEVRPRALRRRVFEPFFSTKPERPGGLGLSISRRLVESASGTIAVADRPGGGTRFRIRL